MVQLYKCRQHHRSNNALIWLSNNTNLDTYSDKQKIQQYVLVVLYFSTNGNDWSHNDGWLSNEDECDLSAYTGALCKNGFITDLYLAQNNLIGTIPNELAWY
jgi:hypothetical protein